MSKATNRGAEPVEEPKALDRAPDQRSPIEVLEDHAKYCDLEADKAEAVAARVMEEVGKDLARVQAFRTRAREAREAAAQIAAAPAPSTDGGTP